jgi:hypothetical protein
MLGVPDKMSDKRSRFVSGARCSDLGRAWYLSRRDHAGERPSSGTVSLAHRPTDVTGTAAHGPHREQSGLPPIVRLVTGGRPVKPGKGCYRERCSAAAASGPAWPRPR